MTIYRIFHVGGEPREIAFLADKLSREVDRLQENGWEIDGIDLINNTRAWDMYNQKYVATSEYIIRAKADSIEETDKVIHISKDASNGDVIKTIFPDIEICDCSTLEKIYTGIRFKGLIGASVDAMREWWNSPYKGDTDDKAGSKESN